MEKTKKALFIFLIALISLCGIISRYFYLMVLSPKNESATHKNYRVERGPILDRNGVVLAIQTRLFRVTGWRPTLKNPDYVAKRLSEILEIPEEEIKAKFEKKGGDVIQLARKVSYEAAGKIQDLVKSFFSPLGIKIGIHLLLNAVKAYAVIPGKTWRQVIDE